MENKDLEVVCVDDEPELLEFLSGVVQSQGFIPVTKASPKEAVQYIEANSAKIIFIISDFKMPEMNGLEFRKAILEKSKEIPFAILSAFVTREMALQGIDYKICAFAEKPCTQDVIRNLIQAEANERIRSILEYRELLKGFIDDSRNLLEELEGLILRLEENQNDLEPVDRIFGIVHTLKGASGFFQPDTLHKFAHKFENFLSKIKNRQVSVTEAVVSVLLKSFDMLKEMVDALQKGDLRSFATEDLLKIYEDINLLKEISRAAAHKQAPTIIPSQKTAAPAARDELRVPIRLLDEFMELSGEITVIRNMVKKLVRAIEKSSPGNKDVLFLGDLLEEMHKINSTMQEKTTELKKVPLKNIFRALPRTIRDLSSALKKEIKLVTLGDEVKVDTTIAEVLNSSLIHLIRNSADHGIEDPANREKAGKPRHGTITISGIERGENVIITISDDGKGIDVIKIKDKVVEKKLMTREAVEKLPNTEVMMKIFDSGFSTASQITDVSGRGVGLDMVKTSVEKIGGKISLDSQLGKGISFHITLPIPKSVLIINSLFIEASGLTFAIPQDNIIRILQLDKARARTAITCLEGTRVLDFEGKLIPLISLEEILPILSNSKGPMMGEKIDSNLSIVVVKARSFIYALEVHTVLDIEDTVVKKIKTHVSQNSPYLGATFLGDGRVGLILDSENLVHLLNISQLSEKAALSNPQPSDATVKKVLVDKSIQSYLLVRLFGDKTFAVLLDQVYRLEILAKEKIIVAGGLATSVYRDQIMLLMDAAQLLFPEANESVLENLSVTKAIIVVQSQGAYLGVVIEEVLDIIHTDAKVDDSVRDHEGISGNLLLHDRIITVIDLPTLIAKLRKPNVLIQSDVVERSKPVRELEFNEPLLAA